MTIANPNAKADALPGALFLECLTGPRNLEAIRQASSQPPLRRRRSRHPS